jgi:AraC-like DNA-binding protein
MSSLTNTVIGIDKLLTKRISPIIQIAISDSLFEDKVLTIERWFIDGFALEKIDGHKGQRATEIIIESKGEIAVQNILKTVNISERSLERYFKAHIGLSPKFYSRIIRFSNIFNLIETKDFNWSDITFLAGFYDQSHFIKNFKEFTGEEPSKYGFTEENMANFFLNK